MKCQGITKSGVMCSREAQPGSKYCWQHQGTDIVDNDSLTDKQRRFCEEYLVDLNATQAAIRAGYSENGANIQGPRLLANVSIQNEIQRLKEARSLRTEITADRVLKELAKVGFANIKDYLQVKDFRIQTGFEPDEEGNPDESKPIYQTIRGVEIFKTDELKDDVAAAISEVKQTKTGISLKLHDKLKALENIGRHLGMFTDKIEHTGRNGGPIEHKYREMTDKELLEEAEKYGIRIK